MTAGVLTDWRINKVKLQWQSQCHVNDKKFGIYLHKPGLMSSNTNTGAYFERDFAQNKSGFKFVSTLILSNKYQMQPR